VSTACVAFPPGTLSLRVIGVEEGNKLRYNSRMLPLLSFCLLVVGRCGVEGSKGSANGILVRVYNSGDCSGGWTLEPALTCAGQGGRGCACSQVGVFGSVRLVVD
jgi:hypothetical protein